MVLAPTGALGPQKAKATTAAAPIAAGGCLSDAHKFPHFRWISFPVLKQACCLANGSGKGLDAHEPRLPTAQRDPQDNSMALQQECARNF